MSAPLPDAAAILRGVTYVLMPFKFVPSLYWLFRELFALFNVNGWNSPLDLFFNSYTVITSLWTSIGIWFQMFSYLPVDLFINFETLFLSDTSKVNDLTIQTILRIASWVMVVFFGGQSLFYAGKAIYVDITTGPLTEVMAQTIVKTISAILALAPAVTYLFQVNAYAPYL